MTRVSWPRMGAALAATTLAGGLLAASAGSGLAGNTRNVYFGAPPDVCPSSVTTAYPDTGCGGGIDSTGVAQYGVEVFSPTTVTTTTATGKLVGYRLEIANQSGSTLTHVVVLGGALAGLTTNLLFPPPSVGPSLPTGFTYDHVYLVSGRAPDCSTSTATALRCDFGNLAAGTTPTILLIVLRTPTTAGLPSDPWHPRPWNELQLNEGSSSSGSNVDSFYAVGQAYDPTASAPTGLTVTASLTTYVESFIAPTGGALTTQDDLVVSPGDPTATRIIAPGRANGDDARIQETGLPTDSVPGCGAGLSLTCFGQVSNIDVLTPVNITVNGTATQLPELFGVCPTDAMGNVTDYTHCTVSSTVAPLKIELAWDGSEVPGPANVRNLVVVHTDYLGVTSVVPACAHMPPLPGDAIPCGSSPFSVGKKGLGETVYAPSNGGWKPGF